NHHRTTSSVVFTLPPRNQPDQRRPHQRLQFPRLRQPPLCSPTVLPDRIDPSGVGLRSQLALSGRCLLSLLLRPHIGRQGCQIAASTHRRALFRRHALPPPTAARIAASAALAFAGSPFRITSAGSAFGGSGRVTPRASSRHTAS